MKRFNLFVTGFAFAVAFAQSAAAEQRYVVNMTKKDPQNIILSVYEKEMVRSYFCPSTAKEHKNLSKCEFIASFRKQDVLDQARRTNNNTILTATAILPLIGILFPIDLVAMAAAKEIGEAHHPFMFRLVESYETRTVLTEEELPKSPDEVAYVYEKDVSIYKVRDEIANLKHRIDDYKNAPRLSPISQGTLGAP